MKTRPIIFKAEMVRAILDGRKTQTRRVVKIKPPFGDLPIIDACGPHTGFADEVDPDWTWSFSHDGKTAECVSQCVKCPYGKPGDRLWVRETFAIVPRSAYRQSTGVQQIDRPGDDHDAAVFREGWGRVRPGRWRPSIHMPRWASRITLEITDVRVERLQKISEEDAVLEGVYSVCVNAPPPLHVETKWVTPGVTMRDIHGDKDDHAPAHISATRAFECLWDSINTKRGFGWDTNCYVWVIEFERMEGTTDAA